MATPFNVSSPSAPLTVAKRDAATEPYVLDKIAAVLRRAFAHVGRAVDDAALAPLLLDIDAAVHAGAGAGRGVVHIEFIQDAVETALMAAHFYDVAKHYIQYRSARAEKRKTESYVSKIPDDVATPWGMLGYITYKRTYARVRPDGATEEFRETVLRVLDACQKQLGVGFTNEEIKHAYGHMMSLRCSVAGRFLWQLLSPTVSNLGLMSLQNCAFVKIDAPVKPFTWIFDVLMLGTGVGFNIQECNVSKLPPVFDADIRITRKDTKDADFIVPDSREGWVSLLEKTLEAYFIKGRGFTYSTLLVRSAGSKIAGFGGTASGPEDLVKGIGLLCGILGTRRGERLSSVDCLDMVNIIASVVVAGNVRRCLPRGARVHCASGLVPIEEVSVGDEVLTTRGMRRVVATKSQGPQPLLEIVTGDGAFRCTANHRMAVAFSAAPANDATKHVWVRAGDIDPAIHSVVTSRVPLEGGSDAMPAHPAGILLPETIDPETAWLFGISCATRATEPLTAGEGGSGRTGGAGGGGRKSIEVPCAARRSAFMARAILSQFFDRGEEGATQTLQDSVGALSVCCEASSARAFFDEHLFSVSRRVPALVLRGSLALRRAFFAGAIDAAAARRVEADPLVLCSAPVHDWIRDLQCLAYSCGFETQVRACDDGVWRLAIHTRHALDAVCAIPQLQRETRDRLADQTDRVVSGCGAGQLGVTAVLDVLRVSGPDSETYDIEVEDAHEFFCEGHLTHNSALIAIGDATDVPYLNAKRWDLGNIPNWRCMSNNSVVCEDTTALPAEFWDGYRGGGECYGLVNLALSRRVGRLVDGELYPDPSIEGYNPCCEQGLANHETCCLGEVFLPNFESFEQLCDAATLLYRICKHSLLLPCHHPETEAVVHANMRMGLGVTGYMQCSEEQKGWLGPLYERLRAFDAAYSAKLGCPASVKLTTVKPSGTLSLLAGVTPGCHPGIFQHFIRRIRIASNSALIALCRDHGYFIEYQRNFDGTDDKHTMVVEFPCKYPAGTVLAEHMDAIQQLETIKRLQTEWSDNAVSVTVYYKLEELEAIQAWLAANFSGSVKSVSFMLHTGHNFAQAPFEEISEAEYETRLAAVRPIVSGRIDSEETVDASGETCKGGACPVR